MYEGGAGAAVLYYLHNKCFRHRQNVLALPLKHFLGHSEPLYIVEDEEYWHGILATVEC